MRWRSVLLAPLIAATSGGAALQVDLRDSGRVVVKLDRRVDDAHLANPVGYFPPEEPAARVVRRITVENVGTGPIPDPDIRLNGAPLLPVADALEAMELHDARDLLALFAKWRDRAVHASTDLDANREPLAILHAIGAGFCGDDARALAAITTAHGAEVRFARLNGHSVTEHKLGGGWMLLDGDQNLFYLAWDNRTPVSEDDILADPLLALRTQIYGRLSAWSPSLAWQNTSQFEFVDLTRTSKPFRLKHAPPARDWKLLPGEKIVIALESIPDRIAAANTGLQKNPVLRAVACVVEFHPVPASHPPGEKVTLPYPALDAANGALLYEREVRDGGPLLCQAARLQFPHLRSGENVVASKSQGHLRVTFELNTLDRKPTPAPVIRFDGRTMSLAAEGADRMWWQIAPDADFRLVPPNLDRVADFAAAFLLPIIDQTFLSRGEYFLRAKVRRDGVWSDWSVPVRFTVAKPEPPRIAKIEDSGNGTVRIRWPQAAGEMLVFGSNRFDFLPEVYGEIEPTRIENGAIRASRPNRNLLATVPAADGEAVVPTRSCYRLIARQNGLLSIPSALVRPSPAPAAFVLQNRHESSAGALDRDVAVEMKMP